MARKKDQEARRDELRRAAVRAVAARGLAGVRLRDVAEEAGLSPASVLYYYPDLEELFLEAYRHAMQRFYERRRAAAERIDDARERIVATVRAGMPTGPDDAEMLVLWEGVPYERTHPTLGEFDRLFVSRQVDLYVSILELGVAQAHFSLASDARTIATNILALEDYHGLGVLVRYLSSVEEAVRLVLSYASLATSCELSVEVGA